MGKAGLIRRRITPGEAHAPGKNPHVKHVKAKKLTRIVKSPLAMLMASLNGR